MDYPHPDSDQQPLLSTADYIAHPLAPEEASAAPPSAAPASVPFG